MTMRCTRSACRRDFQIGAMAPVRCPYCGQTYPRRLPDPAARPQDWGYAVRVLPGAMPFTQLRQLLWEQLPAFRRARVLSAVLQQHFLLDGAFTLTEAETLCRTLTRCGLTAQPIGRRHMTRTGLPVISLPRQ